MQGLLEALNLVVPTAETRVCVRHLYQNFKVKWPGKSFKDGLWYAARATNKPDFDEAMGLIKALDDNAYNYLVEANPITWSRHAFQLTSKSDMQLNNVCESFNNYILEEREKPILSMCEAIRRKLMRRFVSKREGMSNFTGELTPTIQKRLNVLKEQSVRGCLAFWGGGDSYEVDNFGKTYVVNLAARSCGCNKWDLSGIPCTHAISCCLLRRYKLVDYVHDYYTKETYLRAYSSVVQTIPGEQQWEKSGMPAPGPPAYVAQPGRPKKLRRRSVGEDKATTSKRTRSGKPNKCSHCGVEGHTKRKCQNPPKQPKPPKDVVDKGGRPRNPNTLTVSRHNSKKMRLGNPSPPVPPQVRSSSPLHMGASHSQINLNDLSNVISGTQMSCVGPSTETPQPSFASSAPATNSNSFLGCSTAKGKAQSQGGPPARKTYYPRKVRPQPRPFSSNTRLAEVLKSQGDTHGEKSAKK